jgi:hypothetical protein
MLAGHIVLPGGMMAGEDTLFTIVDLAIALIGFSSIVTALRRSKEKSWSIQEINGLVFLAVMAIGAIIFSLLPLLLFYMELDDVQIYSIASAVYCVFSMVVILGLFIRGRKSGFPSRRPRVFNIFGFLSFGIIILMGFLAAGAITNGVFGYYLVGVIWLLVLAFVQFVVFLSFVGFIQEDTDTSS